MTPRDRVLLSIIAPLAVVAGLWFLVLAPKRQEAQRLDTDIAAAQAKLSSAQGDVVRYEAARRQLKANMESLAQAGKAVPASAAVPALLRQLERTARRSHVSMEAITTTGGAQGSPQTATPAAPATASGDGGATSAAGASDPASGVASVDLSLTFKGRFFALQRFLTRLDRFIRVSREQVAATGRLLSVRTLDLSSTGSSLTAQLDASVFVLPDLRTLLPDASTGSSTPAATPDPTAPSTALPTAAVTP